nr:MAG TPA: hypothetical protein [Caudoviricetes sp.]
MKHIQEYINLKSHKSHFLHLPTYLTFLYLYSFDFLLFSFPIRYNFLL